MMISESTRIAPSRIFRGLFDGSPPVIPFLTAGFPTRSVFVDAAMAAYGSGARALEIGMPFSDPLADGPSIQYSSQVALSNGIELTDVLKLTERVRRAIPIPIVLMGYLNPIVQMGLDRFVCAARDAGASGTIIPDCPIEEAKDWIRASRNGGLANIFLIAPTSPNDRIALIDRHSTEFSYCVSVAGVTGARRDFAGATKQYLRRVRTVTKKPFVVGFGISTPAHIKALKGLADGFVVGSALVNILKDTPRSRGASQVGRAIRNLVAAT
jgi:tryptophan synthase alpha chain